MASAATTTATAATSRRVRVGIVGYGALGRFLVERIVNDADVSAQLELAFVWNRTRSALAGAVADSLVLDDLADFASRNADVIVEVAHPDVTRAHGAAFVAAADFFLGSPTSLADADVECAVRDAANNAASPYGLYVPSGALWGIHDIAKMAARGTLKGVEVTMKKHPSSLKLVGALAPKLDAARAVSDAEVLLYDGAVRELCAMAPNNVNTMAAAALAGLGFGDTRARLVSDTRLESHEIEIAVTGPTNADTGAPFRCVTTRSNPAKVGAVTGQATYVSFLSSLLVVARTRGKSGVHFC